MIISDSYLVLLTNLLLDDLKRSSPSRVVIVSSKLHDPTVRHGNPPNFKWNLDEINNEMEYDGMLAYKNSKLANVWFSYELSRRLENTGVDVVVMCPVQIIMLYSSFLRYMTNLFFRVSFQLQVWAETQTFFRDISCII
jgi:NAD(P)-dependent dehydrogenase (short-subunit alcohol dehydrogenase family)